MSRKLWLSVNQTQGGSAYTRHRGTWEQVVTYLDLDRPSATKDCGNMVGGIFTDDHRKRGNLELRSMASFDVDHPNEDFLIELAGTAAAVYSTWRHTSQARRYRQWSPLSRDVTAEEYWSLTHAWMMEHDVEQFDRGSAEAERLMHLPSTRGDGSYESYVLEGEPINVDEWLLRAAELGVMPRGHREAPERPAIDTSAPPTPEQVARAEKMLSQAVEAFGEEDGGRHYRVMATWPLLYRFALGGCYGDDGFEVVDQALLGCFDEAGIGEHGEKYREACTGYADAPDRPIVIATDPTEVFEPVGDEPGIGPVGEAVVETFDPFAPWNTTNSGQPFRVAVDIVAGLRRTTQEKFGEACHGAGLVWWRGDWQHWTGRHWESYDPEVLQRYVYRRLDAARSINAEGQAAPWAPSPGKIDAVMESMRMLLLVERGTEQPSWRGVQHPGNWMSSKSGILRIDRAGHPEYDSSGLPRNDPNGGERALLPHDSRFFTNYSVPFDYDPRVNAPNKWLGFLEEVLPEEDERLLLQQWFGYCLSGRLDLEKALLLIGPTRSGKGTIATVLRAIMGPSNVSATKIASLGKDFGLQPLLGKPLAIIGDAKMGDRVGLAATENLLGIIGRDAVDVGRKFKDAWTGVLPTRFLVMSNGIPHFDDPSGAIMGRFAMLRMRRSFLGREDFTLKEKLLVELPGIFNWALEGLDLLPEGSRLTVPHSSVEAQEDMGRMASPISQWVQEQCDLHSTFWESTQDLYSAYSSWFAMHNGGKGESRGSVHFARQLREVLPGITSFRKAGMRGYSGIRVLSEEEHAQAMLQAATEDLIG